MKFHTGSKVRYLPTKAGAVRKKAALARFDLKSGGYDFTIIGTGTYADRDI